MSKTEKPSHYNPETREVSPHLETTARGVARARAALAEAQARALEAERAHRINLEAALKSEREILKALRHKTYGHEAANAMQEIEQAESDIIAAAEEALEGNPS